MDCAICGNPLLVGRDHAVTIDMGNEKVYKVSENRGKGLVNYVRCEICMYTSVLTLTLGQEEMQKAGIRVIFDEKG